MSRIDQWTDAKLDSALRLLALAEVCLLESQPALAQEIRRFLTEE